MNFFQTLLTDSWEFTYIEMDGAMFNTRHESDGTTWRENKLGAVFRSLDIVYRKTKTGR